jgi:S-formylglutathione hydrolase FrmB
MKNYITLLFLLCVAWSSMASRIDTIRIESECMNKSITNLVLLPDAYGDQKENFPVLYLLHGAYGDYGDWLKKVPELRKYVDLYNFIVVCPDGDRTSWYFDSPVDSTMRYETYITKELIAEVDKNYNTISKRSGRAITGLSMGGHGAFYLAFRHQDLWGAAGSTSGGLDLRPFPNNWDLSKRLGNYSENKENWELNSVINLVYLLNGKDLQLIFDCGIDDFFHDANKRMHEKLLERNIPHDYIERSGKHNNEYWANSIKYQLLFFNDFFRKK